MTQPIPEVEPNSLGEIESAELLQPSPFVGGDLPDPPQVAVPDVDEEDLP